MGAEWPLKAFVNQEECKKNFSFYSQADMVTQGGKKLREDVPQYK